MSNQAASLDNQTAGCKKETNLGGSYFSADQLEPDKLGPAELADKSQPDELAQLAGYLKR